MAYRYGNPGTWGTAGTKPTYGNPGVWGTAGPALPRPTTTTRNPAVTQPTDPYAGINSSVQSIIDSLLAQVQREQDAARKQYEAEAQWELDKSSALAQGLQQLGISQAVQSAFQNAAQAQAGLAQGFSGATRDAANASAAEQARMLSGTGQEGAVRNQGAAMGNVQYGLGYIPATELNTTGAAFGAQAALQPGFAMQFGQIEASKRRAEMLEALEKFAGQKDEILAKRPELFMDLLGEQRDYDLKERGFQLDIRKQTLAEKKAAQAAKQNAAKLKLSYQKERFDQAESAARLSQGQQRISQSQASLDLRARQYAQANAQAWARIGISDKNAAVSASRNERQWQKYKKGGKSGITSAQAQRFRRDAGKLASEAWNGVKTTQTVNGEKVTGTLHMSYQEAMREGLARGIPLSAMQAALNTYWKKPGMKAAWEKGQQGIQGVGRPKVPFQLRNPKPIKNTSNVDASNPIVRDALEYGPQSGARYVFGAEIPGRAFDCSGFTKFMVAKHKGIELPHNAGMQFRDPRGQNVPTPALQAGDVVFFRSSANRGGSGPPWHCGYYIGNGKYVEYWKTGLPARVSRLSDRKDFMGARRFG